MQKGTNGAAEDNVITRSDDPQIPAELPWDALERGAPGPRPWHQVTDPFFPRLRCLESC